MVNVNLVWRCSHVWCRSRRFDCILLVFFRRWGRLVMRDLIKHDALLWLVVIQQLWLVHFDPCCTLRDLLPRRSAVTRLSCCCVFWSWASTLLEFLFHYPCWSCQGEVLHELPLWPCACLSNVHLAAFTGNPVDYAILFSRVDSIFWSYELRS